MRKMIRGNEKRAPRAVILSATLAIVALTVSGCAAGAEAPNTDGGLTPMSVSLIPVADAGGFFAAVDQGYFAEEGLEVTPETIAGGSALIPALESNSVQAGFSNLVSVLQAADKGLDVTCLTGTVKRNGDTTIMLAKKNTDIIKTAKDLEGKLIAVSTIGNVNDMLAMNWLDSLGVDSSTVKFIATGFPDMPAALDAGTVDAAVVFEPATTVARNAGLIELSGETVLDVLDNPAAAFSCWVASGSWLADHKAEATAFVAGLKKSDAYLADNPDYFRELLVSQMNLDPALADEVVLPTISTELTEADLEQWLKLTQKYGMTTNEIDLKSLIANLD